MVHALTHVLFVNANIALAIAHLTWGTLCLGAATADGRHAGRRKADLHSIAAHFKRCATAHTTCARRSATIVDTDFCGVAAQIAVRTTTAVCAFSNTATLLTACAFVATGTAALATVAVWATGDALAVDTQQSRVAFRNTSTTRQCHIWRRRSVVTQSGIHRAPVFVATIIKQRATITYNDVICTGFTRLHKWQQQHSHRRNTDQA
jgi:hypothetical protein